MTLEPESRRRDNLRTFLESPDVAVGPLGREVVRLSGAALDFRDRLVACFRRLGVEFAAEGREYPVLLPTAVLARTDYFASFPHQATFATCLEPAEVPDFVTGLERGAGEPGLAGLSDRLAAPDRVLSPAVCYHCYPEFERGQIAGPLRVVQATGPCFRREDADACLPLARQREFLMHEIILLGTEQAVGDARSALRERVVALASRAGLVAELVPAQDAFYGNVRGRALGMMQRVTGSKLELVVEAGGGPLAIASFNLHGDYFGRAFDIRSTQGVLFTGCVAFGIERWMRALIATQGPAPEAWWRALAQMETA